MMQETIWSLLPPLIAIGLALLTKEVYISLFIGILSGAMLFSGFHILNALETTFSIMGHKVASNMNIIIFLVLLGMIVALMNKSGASNAYGNWAVKSIKSKRGALAATSLLGILIFVDDYFNCLTVGTVMRPVTDRHQISRHKLAYIIDATAAPICIIAPVSSWAAAVGSSMPDGSHIDGFSLFLKTIPFNFYALLTLFMVAFLIIGNFDFGAMKRTYQPAEDNETTTVPLNHRGRVADLIVPIVVLITLCILSMLYTGGILEGIPAAQAFANCNASLSLVIGAFFTLILIFILYIPRKIITFSQFAQGITEGFSAMVPAILILTLAWTLSGICANDYMNIGGYVSGLIRGSSIAHFIMPAVFFVISIGLAFATGTSWGTFGILIPLAIAVFADVQSQLLIITTASILAGAVCGDHMSPISDTTILSSTGAGCSHLIHVSTQIPYALIVASCCLIGYVLAGITESLAISLGSAFILLAIVLSILYRREKNTGR